MQFFWERKQHEIACYLVSNCYDKGNYTPLKAENPPSIATTTPVMNAEAGITTHNSGPNQILRRAQSSRRRMIQIVCPRGVMAPL